ncbi:MAG: hypothetical protein EPO26_01670 [Chloroflexota bacterium]|nr:MAG: hypothetical protein EPO26_01670 [Chloroflexota bacterium]
MSAAAQSSELPTRADAAPEIERHEERGWAVAALAAFALVIGAYFSFRYAGRWSDSDTSVMAAAIRAVIRGQALVPIQDELYPNGYLFAIVSTFLVAFTGVDVATLLQALFPLVSASLVIIAWPLYRELTGSARGATIATILLLVQPEFLFVILRGSHERILRALLFVAMLLLVRGFRTAHMPRIQASYILLFYLTTYGVIATNSLFGSSFIWALAVALLMSLTAAWISPGLRQAATITRQRLVYAPIFCSLLVFLFGAYLYPPSGQALNQLPDIASKLQRLLLTTDQEQSISSTFVAYDPYASIFEQWVDPRLYLALSIGTYSLMLGSAIVWIRLGLFWLASKRETPTMGQWFLWTFYAAFALQGALGIVADRSGSLGGNLQYRAFPSFVMVATPVVAIFLAELRPKPRLRMLLAAGLGVLTFVAVVKATNEPTISNKWTFYVPGEMAAATFANNHLRDRVFWSDIDERLFTAYVVTSDKYAYQVIGGFANYVRTFLVTDVTRLRAARTGKPLPPVFGELRVYDNGEAQIYRRRPQTPYQD